MTAIPTRYMTTLPHINSLKRLNKLKYLGLQDSYTSQRNDVNR